MTNAARELYERLGQPDAWTIVEAWKASGEAETLHLEFKLKTNPRSPTIDEEDIANVAKTLSSFANTEGGVLVVGVDAGGGRNGGFDRVTNIAPISDVETFGGGLERRLKAFTEPPIAGLALRKVVKPGTSSGVAAVYVPTSLGGPHRVVAATKETNDRYYMRTAAGAQTIPHRMLAALFAHTAPPQLELRVRPLLAVGVRPELEMRLVNTGRTAARRPVVKLHDPVDLEWREGDMFTSHLQVSEDGSSFRWFGSPVDLDLYPDEDGLVLGIASMNVTPRHYSAMKNMFSFRFRARIMSLNTPPIEDETVLEVPTREEADRGERRAVISGARP